MSWQLKTLASVAGAAAGSTMTWMVMDNKVIALKKSNAAEVANLKAVIEDYEKITKPASFVAMATGVIGMLAALTGRR